MIIRDSETILGFLRGDTFDYKGRTFDSMLRMTNEQLEKCHDQIQWMFPLHEESKHATTYPILTKETVSLAKQQDAIVLNMTLAKQRMEQFLGIGDFDRIERQAEWCWNKNHNLLRITRILRSLRFFDLEKEADDFFRKVYKVGIKFNLSQETLLFWEKALVDDVWNSMM